MSRSGYGEADGDDPWSYALWDGAVRSAIKGKRGQAFLQDMLAALDALPEKKLGKDNLIEAGAVCAIGAVGLARGVDMTELDPEDYSGVGRTFDIAPAMVREITFQNDEGVYNEPPHGRYARMRAWVKSQIMKETTP